ncbi:hypothetical protein EJD97_020152, partial [Solanum chilense]
NPEEEELLQKLVNELGAENWSLIGQLMSSQYRKSCRFRWLDQLNPQVDHQPFTFEEDNTIIRAHAKLDLTMENPQTPLKKSLSIGEGQNLGIPYRPELSNFGFDRFPPFCLYPHIAPFGRILPFSIFTYNRRSICIFEST